MGHFLKGNRGTEAPSSFVFFDCESHAPERREGGKVQRLTLRFWRSSYCRLEGGEETRSEDAGGETAAEFWNWLYGKLRSKVPTWAVAHNLGFDWTLLDFWGELASGRLKVHSGSSGAEKARQKGGKRWKGQLCLEARPTFAVVRHRNGVLKFTDSGNYWQIPLAKLAQSVGLPKLDMPKFSASFKRWDEYCRRDVAIVRRAFLGLVKRWVAEDCGVFKLTGPALAMQNYRHTMVLSERNPDGVSILVQPGHFAEQHEKDAFLGGRFEPFYVGTFQGRVYHLDVNSLYPAVMESGHFPCRRVGYLDNPTVSTVRGTLRAYGGLARVLIDARGRTYPVKIDGIQHHATGRFRTWLCAAELVRAIESGDVAQVDRLYIYSLAPLFTAWVRRWFKVKSRAKGKGDGGLAEGEFAKLLLNSLYGKWAQSGEVWAERPELAGTSLYECWSRWDAAEGMHRSYRSVAGNVQERISRGSPAHSFPAISAFITAEAREWMRRDIDALPPRSCLYIGCDSLIVTEAGFRALRRAGRVDPSALGSYKVLGVHSEAEIVGPMNYRLDGTWVRSGLKAKARRDRNGLLYADVWEQLPSVLARGGGAHVDIRTVAVRSQDARAKGKVTAAGWVEPFWLSGDPEFTDAPSLGRTRERLHPPPS